MLLVNTVISFVLAPIVVTHLGSVYYGIWSLLMQFTGYLWLFDFGVRLKRAPHRLSYCVRWGWLDLLTAVPLLPALRLLRVPRIVWAARMLRSQTHAALRAAARQRLAQNTLLVVVALVLLVVVYGSSAIVLVEAAAPNANIVTGGDAIWWTFVTISTVGFGDRFVLGVGSSSHAIIEGWNGVKFERPLAHVRDSVAIVRQALTEGKTDYAGAAFRSKGRNTPFEGHELSGRVLGTWVGGRAVYVAERARASDAATGVAR